MAGPSRVLDVVLVIVFSHVELLGRFHLGHYCLLELSLLFFDELLSDSQLLLVGAPYSTAILGAMIGTLTIHLSRVMHHEEPF